MGQEIDNATMLLLEDTLTKHVSSKKEGGKVKLKWNGTLIDFRDFVSLTLEFKGNWELKRIRIIMKSVLLKRLNQSSR